MTDQQIAVGRLASRAVDQLIDVFGRGGEPLVNMRPARAQAEQVLTDMLEVAIGLVDGPACQYCGLPYLPHWAHTPTTCWDTTAITHQVI